MEMAELEESSSKSKRGGRWCLKGMTALVSGGTRGIGLLFISSKTTLHFLLCLSSHIFLPSKLCYRHAIVSDLAAFGAAVHTCSRTQTELDKCLEEWRSEGFQVTGSVCDVTSPHDREKLLQKVASIFDGKLNIYVR